MMRTAYKLFTERKDGTIGPLFINRKQRIPIGVWLPAEDHPTKGYAHRPGWHCGAEPIAPHLSKEGRVWYEVKIKDYQHHYRPAHQGSVWVVANWMKVVRRL
jgi:hypothetical protein